MDIFSQVPFSQELAEQGALGILLAISLAGNIVLVKALLREKDKRIQAASKVADELITPIEYIKDSIQLLNQKVTAARETQR